MKPFKIGLVTLQGYYNYGNRLQNYASHKILEQCKYQVDTLNFDTKQAAFDFWKYILCKIVTKFKTKYKLRAARFVNFYKFNKKYLKVKQVRKNEDISGKYDAFVVGSDQVWNPIDVSPIMLLEFAEDRKKFALSASFGVDEIPTELIPLYQNITKFRNISVREETARQMLMKYFNKDSISLLDPVFALNADDWSLIAEKPEHYPSNKFVICYFLGTPNKDELQFIRQSCSSDTELIDLYKKDSVFYTTGPAQFIYYIMNAEAVFTDSFHAVAYSLIYNKSFVVFNRHDSGKDMFSRIHDLLTKYGLDNCIYKKKAYNKGTIPKPDYSMFNTRIKGEADQIKEFAGLISHC